MSIAVPSLQLGDLQLRTKKDDDIGSEKNVEREILLFSFWTRAYLGRCSFPVKSLMFHDEIAM